ncbi:MAG TPA: hypothetical protein VKE22_02440 [Haliangiales bacterium]|nr:hypothetical protein [Haliangiales bacterium]
MRSLKGLALCLSLCAASAGAVEYEARIQIEDEDDLYELLATEDITQQTFDTLVELLRDKVDLCTDGTDELYSLPNLNYDDVAAILAYRKEAGSIPDPQALVAAGVIDDWKVDGISPFLLPCGTASGAPEVTGMARLATMYTGADGRLPASLIEARAATMRHFSADAIVLLTRNRLGDVRYDPVRNALTAEPPGNRVILPKIYLQYDDSDYRLILGTFRAGFGQRLTFDTTREYTPNGIRGDDILYRASATVRGCVESTGELGATPCPDSAQTYVTPDFKYPERLTGAALGAKRLALGDGWLQAYAFGSYQIHSIYQYEIYNRRTCTDPRNDADPGCAAPPVYRTQDDPLQQAPAFAFETLPSMWAEPLGGGNVSYFWNRRGHVGVTGYGAKPTWLVDGMDLDFQEWSRFPYGGAYGAVGADAAYGFDMFDVSLELARSFDGTADGGGFGGISRNTVTFDKQELELSLRFYDERFKNPYSRALSDPDEVDGVPGRDEAGGRIRYAGVFDRRLKLRGFVDFHVQPSTGTPKLRIRARADYDVTDRVDVGAWAEWNDKDIGRGATATGLACYDSPFMNTPEGAPVPCTGQRIKGAVRLGYEPVRKMRFELQGQIATLDDPMYADTMRRDASVWLRWQWWATNELRLQARARYANQALDTSSYLEDTVWAYLDVIYRIPRSLRLRARYDIISYVDNRASTMVRHPNPEHWLRLEVQGNF